MVHNINLNARRQQVEVGDSGWVLLTPPPAYITPPQSPPTILSRVPSYHSQSPQSISGTERISFPPPPHPAALSPAPSYHSRLVYVAEHQVEELERGERDLVQIPEQELNPRTEDIRRHRRNNWPSCIPLIFHSIPDDIPEASRPLVTRIYNLWLVLLNTLMLNVVGCTFASLSTVVAGSYDGGGSVVGSVCWAIIFSPLSFLLWYRPIYNGCMKEEALYYYIFFFSCGFHLYFSVVWFIGAPDSGIGGLIQTIRMYASGNWAGYIAGIIGTVTTAGFAVQGVGLAYYYRQVWNHHNAAGHTIRKAKAELARKGAKAYFTRG